MPTTTRTAPPRKKSSRLARALGAALVASTVALAGAPARADDAAEAKHAQGTALTKSGNYEGARMKFLEALSMRPMSKTYLNLCVVEQHLGLEPEAVAHCKQFLASDAAPALKKTVEDGIYRELLAATGRLKVEAKAGDAIEVDGLEVGKAPLTEPLVVKKGEHVIASGGSGDGKLAAEAVEQRHAHLVDVDGSRQTMTGHDLAHDAPLTAWFPGNGPALPHAAHAEAGPLGVGRGHGTGRLHDGLQHARGDDNGHSDAVHDLSPATTSVYWDCAVDEAHW
jgi:hypothetical protein